MIKLAFGISTIALFCLPVIAQASEPTCSTGRLAYIDGEINNNAVSLNPSTQLPITLGVAELRLFKKRGRKKLTCTLLGNPNEDKDPEDLSNDHDFDHLLVCDDYPQSQLSVDTGFIGSEPLAPKLAKKLCRGTVSSYFQELSEPDPDPYDDHSDFDPWQLGFYNNKGIFSGVYEGQILVKGCVNEGSDGPPDTQINMVVDGYICLEN